MKTKKLFKLPNGERIFLEDVSRLIPQYVYGDLNFRVRINYYRNTGEDYTLLRFESEEERDTFLDVFTEAININHRLDN